MNRQYTTIFYHYRTVIENQVSHFYLLFNSLHVRFPSSIIATNSNIQMAKVYLTVKKIFFIARCISKLNSYISKLTFSRWSYNKSNKNNIIINCFKWRNYDYNKL